jgi:hypothetical protein
LAIHGPHQQRQILAFAATPATKPTACAACALKNPVYAPHPRAANPLWPSAPIKFFQCWLASLSFTRNAAAKAVAAKA